MPILVGEAHNLVLDGGAVARPSAVDLAGVHRRPVQVGADEIVDGLVGVGDVAIDLRLANAVGGEAEGPGVVVAGLTFRFREIDGPAIEPAGRSGLETGELKPAAGEAVAERFGGAVAGASAARLGLAGVHDGLEKRTGGQNDGPRAIESVAARHDSGDASSRQ